MTTVSHKNLTGSQLHEPKGVASAANGTVYVADGIGSGAFSLGTALGPIKNIWTASLTTTVTMSTTGAWTDTGLSVTTGTLNNSSNKVLVLVHLGILTNSGRIGLDITDSGNTSIL